MKSIKLPALIALILVPLLAVAALIGLTTRDDEAISAAVVNLDEAVTIDGQMVPMGRQLAAAMVDRDGDNVSWTLADAPSAAAGLKTGRFSAVVTIPKTFSAAATSFSENDADAAEQATIKVQVSDNSPVTDSQVAQQVARLAVDTINSTLTESYLDGIYVGFNTVGDQFVTIIDGVNQLHDGSSQLADGTEQASQGASQLASGLGLLRDNSQQLIDGGTQLASGADDLADGASQLADGVGELSEQAPQLVDGVGQLADGADQLLGQIPDYADGAAQAIGGVSSISDGLTQVIDGLDSAGSTDTSQLDQLVAGAEGLSDGIQQVDDAMSGLAQPNAPLPDGVESGVSQQVLAAMGMSSGFDCTTFGIDQANCAQTTAAFNAALSAGIRGGFKAGTTAASTALNTEDASGNSLISGAEQLAAGVDQLATELPKQTAEQLGTLKDGLTQIRDGADELSEKAQPIVDNASVIGDGATQLLDGINQLNSQIGQLPDGIEQLADGTNQLSDGASQLADGVGTYTSGVAQYADGVVQAADGADEFAAGMVDLSDGVNQLDEGIATFASEMAKGADQLPSYSQSDREALKTVVAAPVQQSDSLISSSQIPMISLLLACALWLGALASFVAIRPIPRDVVTSRASSLLLWARTMWLPVVVVAGQGVVMGIIGGAVLNTSIGTTVGLSALLAVAGVSFVFANHALASWFGNVGRAISVILLAVTVALGLSSATGWLSPLGTISPLYNAFLLVRTWLSGGSGEVGLAAVAILMAAIGAVLSIMSITARRRLTAEKFRKAA